MSKKYFTLVGCKYYFGTDFLKPGMKIKLEKEPDNEYDAEAILVKMKGIGAIGHVANSTYTVKGDTMSAGRLYDKIGKKAKAKIVYVIPGGAVCKIVEKKSARIIKSNSSDAEMGLSEEELVNLKDGMMTSINS